MGKGSEKVTKVDHRYFMAIGLWQFVVEHNANWWVMLNFFIGCVFVCNVSIQIFMTVVGGYEFNVFTEKLAVNLTVIESSLKVIYYCAMRAKLYSLSSCFRSDLLLCSGHDRESAESIMSDGFSLVNRVTKSFVIMIFSTVGVWNALPVLRCLLAGDCSKWTIMPSWYPGRWEESGFTYLLEFFIMVYCAALLYNVNCFFSALALSLSSQFGLLARSLESIGKNASKKGGPKKEVMNAILRDCLKDHQTLLRLTEEMEEMYNPLFICQMLASTFTICLVLVQINVATSSNELPFVTTCKFLMYLLFGSMELLVYSWGGQILRDEANMIHRSLYSSEWTEGSFWFRKNISIAMCRTLKPVYLTAGKFYAVDLQSFTQIIKASYSYFTFLHGSESGSH